MNGLRLDFRSEPKEEKSSPLDKKETGFPIVFVTKVKAELCVDFLIMLLATPWTVQNPDWCGPCQLSSGLRSIFD
jgi:hypothetical protein